MPFLPIAERELRVTARRPGTYRIRWILVLLTLTISTWWFVVEVARAPVSQQGIHLFTSVAAVAAIYCLFIGPVVTSDCLSEEKRDGTLGLLFLTDLKGYDVVLGKLVASSVNAAYGLIGLLPILAIPILLGGVPLPLFLEVIVTLVVFLALSLSAGMLVSSLFQHERQVIFWSAFILGLLCIGPIVLMLCLQGWLGMEDRDFFLLLISLSPLGPVGDLGSRALGNGAALPSAMFWTSLLWLTILALGGLSLASSIISRSWQDKTAAAPGRPTKPIPAADDQAQANHVIRATAARTAFRARLLDLNPLAWLGIRKPDHILLPRIFIAAMAVIWLGSFIYNRNIVFTEEVMIFQFVIMNGFLKIWMIIQACSRVAEDKRTGALELLLSTPLALREIVAGHRLALRLQFEGPMLVLAGGELALAIAAISGPPFFHLQDNHCLWLLVLIAGLLLDYVALGWISLWQGLTSKHLTRAIFITITLALVVPVVLHTGFMWVLERFPIEMDMYTFRLIGALSWFFLGLGCNLFLVFRRARPCLLHHFREVVAERYQVQKET